LVEASQLQPYRKNRWPPQGGYKLKLLHHARGRNPLALSSAHHHPLRPSGAVLSEEPIVPPPGSVPDALPGPCSPDSRELHQLLGARPRVSALTPVNTLGSISPQ